MVRRDVFGPLPGARTWGHVLLADGNIGIGGVPETMPTTRQSVSRPLSFSLSWLPTLTSGSSF